MVTLGCARNEVDSEELRRRLAAEGYELVDDADDADAVLVNTCGFIETAKKDSVDAILAATDSGASVVAVGCMAERYGSELAGRCPRPRCSASTTTAPSATGSTTSSPVGPSSRTPARPATTCRSINREATAATAAATRRRSPATTGCAASGWRPARPPR